MEIVNLKYRIYPKKQQQQKLSQFFGLGRRFYNKMLSMCVESYEEAKNEIKSENEKIKPEITPKKAYDILRKNYNEKTLEDFELEYPNDSLNNVYEQLQSAYNNFFDKIKKKDVTAGKPKFKSKNDNQSFKCRRQTLVRKSKKTAYINIPKIGKVKIKLPNQQNDDLIWSFINTDKKIYSKLKKKNWVNGNKAYIDGTITIKRNKSNQYYIVLTVPVDILKKQYVNDLVDIKNINPERIVGVDRNVKDNIAAIDSLKKSHKFSIKHENILKKYEKRINKLNNVLSKKRDKNIELGIIKKSRKTESDLPLETIKMRKLRHKINKIHQKLNNIKEYNSHKISKNIVNDFDFIIAEDLNIRGLTKKPKPKPNETNTGFEKNGKKRKSGLNKRFNRANLGQLDQFITYKAKIYGKHYHKIDPKYTSQTCNACGVPSKENLNDKTFICTNKKCKDYGVKKHRDINAAKNIRIKGTNLLLNLK